MTKNRKEQEKFINQTKSVELKFTIGDYNLLSGDLNDDEVYHQGRAKPSYLGCFIYSYARTYMYDTIFSRYTTLYTDTDSAAIYLDDFEDFKHKYIKKVGSGVTAYYTLTDEVTKMPALVTKLGEFGQFEEELGNTDGEMKTESYVIGKKMYCVEMRIGTKNKDGEEVFDKISSKSKYRIKGINIKRDRIISKEDAKIILDLKKEELTDEERDIELRRIYKMKHDLDTAFDAKVDEYVKDNNIKRLETYHIADANNFIQIFRDLHYKREAYFLCSNLKKSQSLTIKQTFSVKQLHPDGKVKETDIKLRK
jgi:hypothetical protein